MYPAVAAALFPPQPARTEQSSTVPRRTLKFPRRLYSEFHFRAFWFILLFSSSFPPVKYLFVPCLNLGEEFICKWRLEVRQNGRTEWLKERRKGKNMRNGGMHWQWIRLNKVCKWWLPLLMRLVEVGCLYNGNSVERSNGDEYPKFNQSDLWRRRSSETVTL